jgi:hypothetical protein
MTPPIGVDCVYLQEQAFAAELRLLLKSMRSHAFWISFNSITAVRAVADLRIGISPQKSRFEILSCRGSPLLERRHATTNVQHLSGALTDGAQETQVALRRQ